MGSLISEKHRQNGTFPDGFVGEIEQSNKGKESINFLCSKQVEIIDKHFSNDTENQQRAFEDFGRGRLMICHRAFDDRKPPSLERRIHMMDERSYGYNMPSLELAYYWLPAKQVLSIIDDLRLIVILA